MGTAVCRRIPEKNEENIGLIAEIGSRDGLDGIALAARYKTKVMIFEPDPYNITVCKKYRS